MNGARLGLRHDLPAAGAGSRLAAERSGCTQEAIEALLADGVIAAA